MVLSLLPDLGKRTLVMGILNVTPDSFSDGGTHRDDPAAAASAGMDMASAGAAADSRARGLRAAVALYQALAGGWEGQSPARPMMALQ